MAEMGHHEFIDLFKPLIRQDSNGLQSLLGSEYATFNRFLKDCVRGLYVTEEASGPVTISKPIIRHRSKDYAETLGRYFGSTKRTGNIDQLYEIEKLELFEELFEL